MAFFALLLLFFFFSYFYLFFARNIKSAKARRGIGEWYKKKKNSERMSEFWCCIEEDSPEMKGRLMTNTLDILKIRISFVYISNVVILKTWRKKLKHSAMVGKYLKECSGVFWTIWLVKSGDYTIYIIVCVSPQISRSFLVFKVASLE